jgi:hypothetical protein
MAYVHGNDRQLGLFCHQRIQDGAASALFERACPIARIVDCRNKAALPNASHAQVNFLVNN